MAGWPLGGLWASLPVEVLPAQLRDDARDRQGRFGELPGLGEAMGRASELCPLCGLGQGGVEHLWNWCPAVALAWRLWRRDTELSLRDAILAGGGDGCGRGRLAVFLSPGVLSLLLLGW